MDIFFIEYLNNVAEPEQFIAENLISVKLTDRYMEQRTMRSHVANLFKISDGTHLLSFLCRFDLSAQIILTIQSCFTLNANMLENYTNPGNL